MHNIEQKAEKINTLSWKAALKAKYGPEQCTTARKALGLPSPIPDDKASAITRWLEANARPLTAGVQSSEGPERALDRQGMALAIAAEGFRVFACKAGSKEPACMWQQDATTDPAVIREWFKAHPGMNYGVSMDETHFVLDLDCKNGKDGTNDLDALEISNGDLPNTLRVGTPSGGYHVYLTGSAANSVGKKELGGGIDVRGKGGYASILDRR